MELPVLDLKINKNGTSSVLFNGKSNEKSRQEVEDEPGLQVRPGKL